MKRLLAMFLVLSMVFSLCACNSNSKDYKAAKAAFESGDYEKAIELFEKLGDYEDSAEMLLESLYQRAIELMKSDDLEQAITMFEQLSQYKDSESRLKEAKSSLMLSKYKNVLALLAESSPWFYNGGSASLLKGISFSGAETTVDTVSYDLSGGHRRNDVSAPGPLEAAIDTVLFDGNGAHHQSTETCPIEIDDSQITVFLENGFTLTIPYTTNGGILRLGDGEYFTFQDVDNGLQGYWSVRETSALGLKSEYNVQIQNGKITMEHANEGFNLAKGRYYFDSDTGTYQLSFGGIKASTNSIWAWYFNIIDGKPVLMHFATVLSSADGLPGKSGYSF